MNTIQDLFLKSLSSSIWEMRYIPEEQLDKGIHTEALQQVVMPLICDGISATQIISSNIKLIYEQNKLEEVLHDVKYIILKGVAASIYYQDPLRRTLGDIDLIVRPEDFSKAYNALSNAGYTTSDSVDGDDRHVHFYKNRDVIELHRRFAILQTEEQSQSLDALIYEGIKTPVIDHIHRFDFPRLEDSLNGLVLLTHINQHLEEGLGLRQILDWVMYCDKCLPDEKWPQFKEKTDQFGLTMLAKVSARLGQKYLGLREDIITWCKDADEHTVDALLEYALECGNFGHKDFKNNTIVMVMSHGRGVRGFFKNLQRQGKVNWKAVRKHKWLVPFAWLYQLFRYVLLGLHNSSIKEIVYDYQMSKKRNKMLDELEAKRTALSTISKRQSIKKHIKIKLRSAYHLIKASILRRPFYELYDLFYVFRYWMVEKPSISEKDRKNIEENVTFIYKSFNRQRQAKRLYNCIKTYYPGCKVIIADDSKEPLKIKNLRKDDKIIYLPYNSGLSKGLNDALEQVETPYVMRMDDDELLSYKSNIHEQLKYLQNNSLVDLVGLQVFHRNMKKSVNTLIKLRMNRTLIVPSETEIDGKIVVYKPINVFLARTEKIRQVGYDPNIRVLDHHEFFYRAAGKIVCVIDPDAYVLHCHNRFEKEEYDKYRGDIKKDVQYITAKHGRDYIK